MGNYKNNTDVNDRDMFCKDCWGKDQKDCAKCRNRFPTVDQRRYYGGHIDEHGKYCYHHEGD